MYYKKYLKYKKKYLEIKGGGYQYKNEAEWALYWRKNNREDIYTWDKNKWDLYWAKNNSEDVSKWSDELDLIFHMDLFYVNSVRTDDSADNASIKLEPRHISCFALKDIMREILKDPLYFDNIQNFIKKISTDKKINQMADRIKNFQILVVDNQSEQSGESRYPPNMGVTYTKKQLEFARIAYAQIKENQKKKEINHWYDLSIEGIIILLQRWIKYIKTIPIEDATIGAKTIAANDKKLFQFIINNSLDEIMPTDEEINMKDKIMKEYKVE
jgi:hypothetical protein